MANWDKIQNSGNVEDRRGTRMVGGVGLVGAAALMGAVLLLGGGPQDALNLLMQLDQASTTTTQEEFVDENNYKEFAQKVLGSNNEVWSREFAKTGLIYEDPRLVLFRGGTESACGVATSQIGPHYCPLDSTIYLDETFFDELTNRFGAQGGEVAEAYVMAHEVGHHLQNLEGTLQKANRGDNDVSIAVELQADCYAGVWAGNAEDQNIISQEEVGQAIDAAEAVGDDRIQESIDGQVNPETWTHGSSDQRKAAFAKGFETLDPSQCRGLESL